MQPDQLLLKAVQSVLWSYDLTRLNLELHKRLVISQVLNFGTEEATQWLFSQYSKAEIVQEANQIPLGQWNKKSLALWSLVLGIAPISKVQKMGMV